MHLLGDFDSLIAAVQNGANAVYLGTSNFNARINANNFSLDELEKAITYAKLRNVKVYLTLNILINNLEFFEAVETARIAYELGIDGIIVQDLGLATYIIDHIPDLEVHASTQMTIYDLNGVKELQKLGFKRVVLARELPLNEISYICKNSNIDIEVFTHGALCVSYSGQCLMSSAIGGRSGNRGKCAGPCRLPYTLENSNNKKLASGYLLNTKDICSIDLIPQLIDSGIKSFKIEGRMKSPEYVGLVTKIYRKYIDLALSANKYEVDEKDRNNLIQIFNRGGFSTGYLNGYLGKKMAFYKRPNHMGIFLGRVLHFNPNKGHIKLTLSTPIEIGDTIQINDNIYTISEIMIKNTNLSNTNIGQTITIGRIKGDIKINDEIFKVSSKSLNQSIKDTLKKENIKRVINCNVYIKKNEPIKVKAFDNYISCEYLSDIIPQKSIKTPITKERILAQFNKTGNTPFEFGTIDIELSDDISVPISSINEIRRKVLELYENTFKNQIKNTCKLSYMNTHIPAKENIYDKKVSVLLNKLNKDFDYSKLQNIDNVYIPFRYFMKPEFEKLIFEINNLKNIKTYIYFPAITRKNYISLIKNNIDNIVNKYKINGFIISNIGQLELINHLKLDIIANYTLNIFNNYTVDNLKNFNFKTITLSPELNTSLINNFKDNIDISYEFICYGRLQLMTSSYCVIGCNSITSGSSCSHDCQKDTYHLKDRLGFKFTIYQDDIDCISNIYNSKISSISCENLHIDNIRIDILDETIDEINNIVYTHKNSNRFEGKIYTNGNINKVI